MKGLRNAEVTPLSYGTVSMLFVRAIEAVRLAHAALEGMKRGVAFRSKEMAYDHAPLFMRASERSRLNRIVRHYESRAFARETDLVRLALDEGEPGHHLDETKRRLGKDIL